MTTINNAGTKQNPCKFKKAAVMMFNNIFKILQYSFLLPLSITKQWNSAHFPPNTKYLEY